MSFNRHLPTSLPVLTSIGVLCLTFGGALTNCVCYGGETAAELREFARQVAAVRTGLMTWSGSYHLQQTSIVMDTVIRQSIQKANADGSHRCTRIFADEIIEELVDENAFFFQSRPLMLKN